MPQRIDITGRRFGRWLVLRLASDYPRRNEGAYWVCRCDCGSESVIRGSVLRKGRSNGCLACSKRTHNMSNSPEYRTWRMMLGRCADPRFHNYSLYGARGISVCEQWQLFEAFLEDMGLRPSSSHSIDRIDNDGNYEPGNCRWATRVEQARNRSNSRMVEFQGTTQCLSAWAECLNIPRHVLQMRLDRNWNIERAFTTPVRHFTSPSRPG